eukprot:6179434-Prymnesium_polylepis.1
MNLLLHRECAAWRAVGCRHKGVLLARGAGQLVVGRRKDLVRVAALGVLLCHHSLHLGAGGADQALEPSEERVERAVRHHPAAIRRALWSLQQARSTH